jgi:hypothetical protein
MRRLLLLLLLLLLCCCRLHRSAAPPNTGKPPLAHCYRFPLYCNTEPTGNAPRCKLCKGRMKEGLGGVVVVWGGGTRGRGGRSGPPTSNQLP